MRSKTRIIVLPGLPPSSGLSNPKFLSTPWLVLWYFLDAATILHEKPTLYYVQQNGTRLLFLDGILIKVIGILDVWNLYCGSFFVALLSLGFYPMSMGFPGILGHSIVEGWPDFRRGVVVANYYHPYGILTASYYFMLAFDLPAV